GLVRPGHRARAGRRGRRHARPRLRSARHRAEDRAGHARAGAAGIDGRLPDRSDRDRGRILGHELRAREAGARPVRRAGGAAGRALGGRSAGGGRGAGGGRVRRGAVSVGDRRVAAVRLWTPSRDEEALLRTDFELFVREYFRRGRATDITGHLGAVLQVRPKGRDAADLRDAYAADGQPTRIGKMGFYLRPAFVARIVART